MGARIARNTQVAGQEGAPTARGGPSQMVRITRQVAGRGASVGRDEPSAAITVTDVHEPEEGNMRCRGANDHGRGASRGLAGSLRERGGSGRSLRRGIGGWRVIEGEWRRQKISCYEVVMDEMIITGIIDARVENY